MYAFLKRLFDIAFAFTGLLTVSTFLAVMAVLIKLDSNGPVFHRSVRAGRHGKPFNLVKFRTMVHRSANPGPSSTPDDDPRITRIGRKLRSCNLDQLPELWNVLKGDMSIVGPRPQVAWAVELYTEEDSTLLTVRPGMTDYASIRFNNEGEVLRGSTDPDRDYMEKIWPEKRRLGLEYVRNQSVWIDIKILANTFLHVRK